MSGQEIRKLRWRVLVVACERYANELPNLAHCTDDARTVYECLHAFTEEEHAGDHVILIEPDLDQLQHAIINFLASPTLNQRLFFYFAGHCYEHEGNNYLKVGRSPEGSFDVCIQDFRANLETHSFLFAIVHGCRVFDPPTMRPRPPLPVRSVGHQGAHIRVLHSDWIILYTCLSGEFTSDSSDFTQVLCSHLRLPGLEVEHLIHYVKLHTRPHRIESQSSVTCPHYVVPLQPRLFLLFAAQLLVLALPLIVPLILVMLTSIGSMRHMQHDELSTLLNESKHECLGRWPSISSSSSIAQFERECIHHHTHQTNVHINEDVAELTKLHEQCVQRAFSTWCRQNYVDGPFEDCLAPVSAAFFGMQGVLSIWASVCARTADYIIGTMCIGYVIAAWSRCSLWLLALPVFQTWILHWGAALRQVGTIALLLVTTSLTLLCGRRLRLVDVDNLAPLSALFYALYAYAFSANCGSETFFYYMYGAASFFMVMFCLATSTKASRAYSEEWHIDRRHLQRYMRVLFGVHSVWLVDIFGYTVSLFDPAASSLTTLGKLIWLQNLCEFAKMACTCYFLVRFLTPVKLGAPASLQAPLLDPPVY